MRSLNIKITSFLILFICCLNGYAQKITTLQDMGLSSATTQQFLTDTEQAYKAAQTVYAYHSIFVDWENAESRRDFKRARSWSKRIQGFIYGLNYTHHPLNSDPEVQNLITNLLDLKDRQGNVFENARTTYQDIHQKNPGKYDSEKPSESDKREIAEQNKIIINYENKYGNLYSKYCDEFGGCFGIKSTDDR